MGVTLGGRISPTVSVNRRSATLGLGCIALFLLPFGVAGVGATLQAVRRFGQGNLHEALGLLLVGVVFGGVAGGGWTLLLLGRRKLRLQETLRERYPDQPWRWRPEWSSGRISDSNRTLLWSSWGFATLWNLISWPSGFLGVRAALYQGNQAGYFALLFPLAGAGLLLWAVRNSLRARKYGVSVLELANFPGVVGHSLAGQVRVSGLFQPAEDFESTLSCVRRTTGSGKDSSTTESILWQEEQQVRGETYRDSEGMATRVRLGFQIPADARSSDSENSNDQIIWRLTLAAGASGVDYLAMFEVPVFRTSASELPPTPEDLSLAAAAGPRLSEYRQPGESRITVNRTRRGTEISFPAARNPGAAIGLTLFTLIWSATIAGLLYLRVPLLFPIVFGLFELLLLIGTLQLWLGVSRVVGDRESVRIAEGYIYPGRERTIPIGELSGVTTKIGMQAGSRPYYDVMVVRKKGKQIAAGRWIRNKREAEWLAATMRTALGL